MLLVTGVGRTFDLKDEWLSSWRSVDINYSDTIFTQIQDKPPIFRFYTWQIYKVVIIFNV